MRSFLITVSVLTAPSLWAQPDSMILLPVYAGTPVFFTTGSGLDVEVRANAARVRILSDLWQTDGKDSIVHYAGPAATDLVPVGQFTTPGLHLVKAAFSRRNQEETYVHRDTVTAWEARGYPYYRLYGGHYIGYYWTIGAEEIFLAMQQTYVYCYAAGKKAETATQSSVLKTLYTRTIANTPSGSVHPLQQFSDTLTFALRNANRDSLQKKMAAVYSVLVKGLDPGEQRQFSFYQPSGDIFRLMVIADTAQPEKTKELCKTAFRELLAVLTDTAVSLRFQTSSAGVQRIRLITPDRAESLKQLVDRALFSDQPDFLLTVLDEQNPESTLHLLDTSYQPGTTGIYLGLVTKAASEQVVLTAKMKGPDKNLRPK